MVEATIEGCEQFLEAIRAGEMKQKQKQRGHSPATCWLHLAGFKSTALAAHLGVSQASVSHVLNGYRNTRPSPQFRKGLVELTDAATAAKIIDAIPAPVKKKRS